MGLLEIVHCREAVDRLCAAIDAGEIIPDELAMVQLAEYVSQHAGPLKHDLLVKLQLPHWICQARVIVAAYSKAEVGRLLGLNPRQLFNLSETENVIEIETAMARPRRFFASPLDGPKRFQLLGSTKGIW